MWKKGSLHKSVQNSTDGSLARFYSASDWRRITSKYFNVAKISIFGSKVDIVPLPGGKIKKTILNCIPNVASRFLTNKCRFGSFLVSVLEKPQTA